MWEAISSNQRRSWVLIGLLGGVLVLLGATIGMFVASEFVGASSASRGPTPVHDTVAYAQGGAVIGIGVALFLWVILWAVAVGAGDGILLHAAGAHEIQKADAPQLWNVVEEMTIAAGLKQVPRVFVIDDSSLNAFAVGRTPERAAVAVTAGLLKRLSRDELQGVVAHEVGHVRNLDIRFMTLASVMVGATVLLSRGFLRALYYGGGRRRSSSRNGGQAQLILLVVAVLLAVVAPLAAQLLYLACSRRREYLADASAARFTRYPEGLASALEKISGQSGAKPDVSQVIAPLCTVNQLQEGGVFTLFSTHPPTKDRIRILRSMAGAGLAAYEAAYRQVRGSGARCLSDATIKGDAETPIRAAGTEPAARQTAVERAQAVGNLLDRLLPFVVIPCPCGVKLKVPPDFQRPELRCPRCGAVHTVGEFRSKAGGR